MYIEGAVYNFGSLYLGDNYVQRNLDKLALLPKISVIMRLVTGKEIDPGGQAYEHLKKLVRYRNSLVHPKSTPLAGGEALKKFQEKMSREYSEAIKSAKYAIEYLDRETRMLNDDEYFPGMFGDHSF